MSDAPAPSETTILDRLRRLWSSHPQLLIFLASVALAGFAGPVFETTFNNFLSDTFHMTGEQRGALEGPRELPGFLVTLSAGLLAFLAETRVASIAAFVAGLGMGGLGFVGRSYPAMMAFMVTWSAGIHLGMPVHSSIGLSLARENQEGRRLGQIRFVGAAASMLGCLAVWLLLRQLHLGYRATFVTGASAHVLSGLVLLLMHRTVGSRTRPGLIVRKQYWLFYALSVLFGARKQIFITFGPWVLIKVYGQSASVFAWLWLVAAGLGLITQPLLGRLIDHIGERRVLMGDAALLILVCLGYGYADRLGLGPLTIHLLYACFIMDQLLFATGMARATYLKKIALAPEHVASSLALGVSLDHTVSMTIPRVGGQLWDAHGKHGYRYVFTAAAIIAAVNLIFASLLKLPGRALEVPTTVPPAPLATDEPPGLE